MGNPQPADSIWSSITLPVLYAMVFLVAIAGAFDNPARAALLPALVAREVFPRAVAIASNQLGAAESGFVAALNNATFSVVSGGVGCLLVVAVVALTLPDLRRYRIGPSRGTAVDRSRQNKAHGLPPPALRLSRNSYRLWTISYQLHQVSCNSMAEVTYPGAAAPGRSRAVQSFGLRVSTLEWGDPAAQPLVIVDLRVGLARLEAISKVAGLSGCGPESGEVEA
jgi:hypothetical protein